MDDEKHAFVKATRVGDIHTDVPITQVPSNQQPFLTHPWLSNHGKSTPHAEVPSATEQAIRAKQFSSARQKSIPSDHAPSTDQRLISSSKFPSSWHQRNPPTHVEQACSLITRSDWWSTTEHSSDPPPALSTELDPVLTTDYSLEGTSVNGLYQNLGECSSCLGRCGTVMTYYQELDLCSCDSACLVYEYCCLDFKDICWDEHSEGMSILSGMHASRESTCLTLLMAESRLPEKYRFINQCNDTVYELMDTGGLQKANDGVPVEDLDTGVFFINYECAKCHGATNLWPMQVSAHYILPECDANQESVSIKPTSTTNLLPSPLPFLPPSVDPPELRYAFRGTEATQSFDDVIDKCRESCANNELIDLCLNSGFFYSTDFYDVFPSVVYKNTYCAVCNIGNENWLCGGINVIPPPPPPPDLSVFSLSVLFDFKSNPSASPFSIGCEENQVVLPSGMACGDIHCPDGYVLQNDVCVELNPLAPGYSWDFVYRIEINSSLGCEICINNTIVDDDSTTSDTACDFFSLMQTFEENITLSTVEINCTCKTLLVSNVTIEALSSSVNNYLISNVTRTLELEGTPIVLNSVLHYLTNSTIASIRVTLHAFNIKTLTSVLEHPCAGTFISDKDFVITGRNLTLRENGYIYYEDEYILQNGSALLCRDSHGSVRRRIIDDQDDPTSEPLAVLTIVLSILSFSCICVRAIP